MNNTKIHKGGVRRKSSVVLSLLLGAATLAMPTLTSAAGATQVKVPFDFIAAGGLGDCPEINFPLHFIGERHLVTQDKIIKGVHHLTLQTGIHGVATDALGNTFVFSYQDHTRANFAVSLGDETTVVRDTDSFNMEGPAGHISVGFVGSLIFDKFGNFVSVVADHFHGNYLCDPL